MLTTKIRVLALILFVAMLTTSVSFAAPMTSNPLTMPRAGSTGAIARNEVMPGKSPTTGLDWSGTFPQDYRPILVQISNSAEARPHLNLSEADIVYESILWGPGYTRSTAVFSDNHPEVVGSVRSARLHHCELREEWDCPLVFWGGQEASGSSIFDFFRGNNVTSAFLFDATGHKGTQSGSFFSRATNRVSPHNGLVNLAEIVNTRWPTKDDGTPFIPRSHAFRFSSQPTRGSDTAVAIDIEYMEDYHPSYEYDAENRVYLRSYNGQPDVDGITEKRLEASNVIVQFTETKYFQQVASRPMISTVKGGAMYAFIDGRVIRGTWERRAYPDRTVFLDMNNEEIMLLPGKTYIQLVPMSFEFTYTRESGEKQFLSSGTDVGNMEDFDTKDNAADLNKME